jgi:Mg2+ and Co2+ transporter CorA
VDRARTLRADRRRITVSAAERGYAWIDAHYESPRAWVETVERLTGVTVLDEHLSDAENATHPSYFDSTRDYEMIVFRGLAVRPGPGPDPEEPIRIRTRPTVFFLFPRCVVSVRPADSRQVPALRQRLLDAARFKQRLPSRPEELMLRILNGMVDRYLDLRQPVTDQLEYWQRELLDPRRPFRDWMSLLEARRQLRKLENLSEEQLDALQEWRDERLDRHGGHDDPTRDWTDATDDAHTDVGAGAGEPAMPALTDALEVRVNDLVEHIERVRGHAQRLETSIESAVQLHFSATAHRTNQIMRTLTVLTATFMPLTLITGIFGMNFEVMPGVHSPAGFWWTMAAMAAIALGLVLFFRTRRYLEETGLRGGSKRVRRRRS